MSPDLCVIVQVVWDEKRERLDRLATTYKERDVETFDSELVLIVQLVCSSLAMVVCNVQQASEMSLVRSSWSRHLPLDPNRVVLI